MRFRADSRSEAMDAGDRFYAHWEHHAGLPQVWAQIQAGKRLEENKWSFAPNAERISNGTPSSVHIVGGCKAISSNKDA